MPVLINWRRRKGDEVNMIEVQIKDEYIKLGQALKLAGFVDSGIDAKFTIQEGLVKVNGEIELQRGKKLHNGDVVFYDGQEFMVKGS